MKLERTVSCVAVAVAFFAIEGCATHTTPPAPVPHVATTQLMAAELTDADDAPRVGKSHLSGSSKSDEADAKDAPRRDDRKHGNGGGFSGWK